MVSAISDIGSASFKYDMRRLTEILAFPKAWYRRSIVRRMFLGDLSMSGMHNDDSNADLVDSSPGTSKYQGKNPSDKSPLLNNKDKLKLSLDGEQSKAKFKDAGKTVSTESGHSDSPSPSDLKSSAAWETLVLFAVNFKKLNVHMNMGNVMGNVM